jgi:adenosylmethionine-8-amino-7-oxononanoate aminotransferase
MTGGRLREQARRHLVPHFTRGALWRDGPFPIFVRGEGCHLWDDEGRRWLDGLSGLFYVNVGHGRGEIVDAIATQLRELPFATNWGIAHPAAIEAATAIAEIAPGDLDAVFFVSSGSEAVESAIKFARQYHRARGEPARTKILSRDLAYHGTTLGALSATGVARLREPFMPLVPGFRHVPNTRGADPAAPLAELDCVRGIEEAIREEGAETIAALLAEPVQNAGGALVPPHGYWPALRAICDRNGILLVADEVITGFGRLGEWFGGERFGAMPDLVTFAKGATSGYAPLAGMIVRRPLIDRLLDSAESGFLHGATWGGHPGATAAAVANVAVMRDESVLDNVRRLAPVLAADLRALAARHRSVREVRGTGFFHAIDLMADRESVRELSAEQSRGLLREVLPGALRRVGLNVRPDDRGGTLLAVSPPLVADRAVLGELVASLDSVLDDADRWLRR